MRVAVCGGTGFIGRYFLRDYRDSYDFIVPVRDSGAANGETGVEFVESDYSVESLANIFTGCGAVVHLAARGMPKDRNPLRMRDYISNVTTSANVFEACKEAGITNIVYTSSKAVWSGLSPDFYITEGETPDPDDEYGVSKACCDVIAGFYNEKYGMAIKCFRMGEVCGYDLIKGMANPFWRVLLEASVKKKEIPIYGKGAARRDLIYVKDVARALRLGLETGKKGIFNIGSGRLSANIEIAGTFCEVFGNEAGIRLYPEKEEWGTERCLAVEKASVDLGFRAEYGLTEIVKDIKQEYEMRQAH